MSTNQDTKERFHLKWARESAGADGDAGFQLSVDLVTIVASYRPFYCIFAAISSLPILDVLIATESVLSPFSDINMRINR